MGRRRAKHVSHDTNSAHTGNKQMRAKTKRHSAYAQSESSNNFLLRMQDMWNGRLLRGKVDRHTSGVKAAEQRVWQSASKVKACEENPLGDGRHGRAREMALPARCRLLLEPVCVKERGDRGNGRRVELAVLRPTSRSRSLSNRS